MPRLYCERLREQSSCIRLLLSLTAARCVGPETLTYGVVKNALAPQSPTATSYIGTQGDFSLAPGLTLAIELAEKDLAVRLESNSAPPSNRPRLAPTLLGPWPGTT